MIVNTKENYLPHSHACASSIDITMSNTTLFCQTYSIEHLKSAHSQEGPLARRNQTKRNTKPPGKYHRFCFNPSTIVHTCMQWWSEWWSTVNVCTSTIIKITKSHLVENFEISPHRKLTYLTSILTSTTNSFRSSDNLCSWKTFTGKMHTLYLIQAKNEDYDCFIVNEMIYTHRTRKCCEILGKLLIWNWSIPRRHRKKTSYSKRTPVN